MVIAGILNPNKVLLIGLTERNIQLLKRGEPVRISAVAQPVSRHIIGNLEVVIFFGETKESIQKLFVEHSLIGKDTKVTDMPKNKPGSN
jgi:hypothetical protein